MTIHSRDDDVFFVANVFLMLINPTNMLFVGLTFGRIVSRAWVEESPPLYYH